MIHSLNALRFIIGPAWQVCIILRSRQPIMHYALCIMHYPPVAPAKIMNYEL